jgi:hypothetical protein
MPFRNSPVWGEFKTAPVRPLLTREYLKGFFVEACPSRRAITPPYPGYAAP